MSHDTFQGGVTPAGAAPVADRPADTPTDAPAHAPVPPLPPAPPAFAVAAAVAPPTAVRSGRRAVRPAGPPAAPPKATGREAESHAADVLGLLVRQAPRANVIAIHLNMYEVPYIAVQLHGPDALGRLVAYQNLYGGQEALIHKDHGEAVYSEVNLTVEGVPVQVWTLSEVVDESGPADDTAGGLS